MIELRLTSRLIQYWEKLKKDADVPPVEAFNPEVVHDLWGRCFQVVVQKDQDGYDFIYDYIGEDLTTLFEPFLVGMQVKSQMHFLPAKKMIEQMNRAIEQSVPLYLDGQFIDKNSHIIKYRSCLMPFGKDKENITHFIIGISWNSFK